MTTPVDWSRYRKYPVCFAKLGKPCLSFAGYAANSGSRAVTISVAKQPHGGRLLRTGYARGAGRG